MGMMERQIAGQAIPDGTMGLGIPLVFLGLNPSQLIYCQYGVGDADFRGCYKICN